MTEPEEFQAAIEEVFERFVEDDGPLTGAAMVWVEETGRMGRASIHRAPADAIALAWQTTHLSSELEGMAEETVEAIEDTPGDIGRTFQ